MKSPFILYLIGASLALIPIFITLLSGDFDYALMGIVCASGAALAAFGIYEEQVK